MEYVDAVKKFLVYGLSLILFSQLVYAGIIINEVMANPSDDEGLNEWIELYNYGNSEVNVSGWLLKDDGHEDILIGGLYGGGGSVIPAKGYALILSGDNRVENNFNISKGAIKLYTKDNSLGYYGLHNSKASVALYNPDKNFEDEFNYTNTQEGKSCALFNKTTWCNSIPTPGYWNDGSFIDFYEGPCDWKIELILNKTSFKKNEFEFKVDVEKNGGEKTNITLIREIRDIYGNLVSDYNPLTKLLTYGSNFGGPWSPNYKPGMYWIKTCIETDCNELRVDNNCDYKLFVIESDEPEKDSEVKIEEVYLGNDKKAKWGDLVRIKVKIYRGDTGKKSISLGLEQDLSKKTRFIAEDKFKEYILTLPIQIEPNCDKKVEDGSYKLILEGLGEKDSEKIKIEGESDLCAKESSKKEKISTSTKNMGAEDTNQNYEKVIYGDMGEITGGIIYESNDIKAKRSAIYFFCALLILLILQKRKNDPS